MNCIQVQGGGGNLTYDANNLIQVSQLGTQITGPFSVNGDITFNIVTQTSITAKKSLVLSQTGDIYGSSILTLQNRAGLNGALFETTDASITLVDFGFKMGNAVQRLFRLEGRATYAKCGAPSFQFGNSDVTNPTIAAGDT